MLPTPYILPASYAVLSANHPVPIVDAAGTAFWGLNVKYHGSPLYFAVFLQPPTGEAREVLAFPGAGQGAIWLAGGGLWASAFRTPDDAVSPPFVGEVLEYVAPPAPLTAGDVLTVLIQQLAKPDTNIARAISAAALAAVRAALGR